MLKALLHRKLPRGFWEADDVSDPDGNAHVEPTRREDPLTASVFERLAYLPSSLTWDILRGASKSFADELTLPANAPSGAPTWSFWPSLRPGVDGANKNRVEPDVLVSWPDALLVIEAKHWGEQSEHQWVEQLRAVHAMPEHAGKRVWLIAVGGIAPHELEVRAAHVRCAIPHWLPGLLAMRWEDLRHIIDEFRGPSRPHEQLAVLNDIAAALDMWGYRKKTWFASLRPSDPLIQANKAMSVLHAWRVR